MNISLSPDFVIIFIIIIIIITISPSPDFVHLVEAEAGPVHHLAHGALLLIMIMILMIMILMIMMNDFYLGLGAGGRLLQQEHGLVPGSVFKRKNI